MSDAEHWYKLTLFRSGKMVLVRKGAITMVMPGDDSTEIWLDTQTIHVAEEPVDYGVGAGLLIFRKREV